MNKKLNKFSILYIIITKNNLKISITDVTGRVLFKKSQGMLRNIRKGSINSADTSLIMMNSIAADIQVLNIKYLGIYVKGATHWKRLSLRRLLFKLKLNNVFVKFIRDISGSPHNGCTFSSKRRKRRRRRLKKKFFLKENYRSKELGMKILHDIKIRKIANRRLKKGAKFFKYIKKTFSMKKPVKAIFFKTKRLKS